MATRVYCGNEPFLTIFQMRKDIAEVHIDYPQMNLARFNGYSPQALEWAQSVPFMEDKKVLIITDMEMSDMGELEDIVFDTPAYLEIFIRLADIDKRYKIYKRLQDKHLLIENRKLDRTQLQQFIYAAVTKGGGSISGEAMEELIRRAHYERDEVTLFFFDNTIKDLILLCDGQMIQSSDILQYVEDNEADNSFILADCINRRDITTVRKQAELLQAAGTSSIATLSLLHREYRVAIKATVCSLREMGIFYGGVNIAERDLETLHRGLQIVTNYIKGIKNGTVRDEDALLMCVMEILADK